MEGKCSFRSATRADTGLILEFIRELASYEHMEDQVRATETMLEHELFDRNGAEVLFVIGDDGKEAGFALFFHNFSTFEGRPGIYLEDLFVKPQCRGRGYGRALMRKLAAIALERGCARFEWCCLNWNKPSIAFYSSLGAKPMDIWTTWRLDGSSIRDLADEKGTGSAGN
ncbi:MAG: GNAT family N-acetyltransferase [Succinivibrio sp.]